MKTQDKNLWGGNIFIFIEAINKLSNEEIQQIDFSTFDWNERHTVSYIFNDRKETFETDGIKLVTNFFSNDAYLQVLKNANETITPQIITNLIYGSFFNLDKINILSSYISTLSETTKEKIFHNLCITKNNTISNNSFLNKHIQNEDNGINEFKVYWQKYTDLFNKLINPNEYNFFIIKNDGDTYAKCKEKPIMQKVANYESSEHILDCYLNNKPEYSKYILNDLINNNKIIPTKAILYTLQYDYEMFKVIFPYFQKHYDPILEQIQNNLNHQKNNIFYLEKKPKQNTSWIDFNQKIISDIITNNYIVGSTNPKDIISISEQKIKKLISKPHQNTHWIPESIAAFLIKDYKSITQSYEYYNNITIRANDYITITNTIKDQVQLSNYINIIKYIYPFHLEKEQTYLKKILKQYLTEHYTNRGAPYITHKTEPILDLIKHGQLINNLDVFYAEDYKNASKTQNEKIYNAILFSLNIKEIDNKNEHVKLKI